MPPATGTDNFSFSLFALSVGGKSQLRVLRYQITPSIAHSRGFLGFLLQGKVKG